MPQPNILLLWTDEQRADTLAVYGNDAIEMPNLNALAVASTVFRRAYCSQPVCTPSRGTVMTGLYPHAHGAVANNVPMDPLTPCIAELLDSYETIHIGKWHLGDEIFAQHGFDTWLNVDDQYLRFYGPDRDRTERCPYHHWLKEQGFTPNHHVPGHPDGLFSRDYVAGLPEAFSKPAWQADRAIDFIEMDHDRPWLLVVNTLEPHMPFTGPRNRQYDPATLPVPDNWLVPPDDSCLRRHRLINRVQQAKGDCGFDLTREDEWRRCMANYWGLCSQVDHHYGRILTALRDSGQYDDTLIVFTSDHGDMMGSHQILAKSVMYEEATRIPLTVKLPGQVAGRVIEHPVSQVDLLPTLLDAVGAPVPHGLHGESLLPACTDGVEPNRDVVTIWEPNLGEGTEQVLEVGDAVPPHLAKLGSAADIAAARGCSIATLVRGDGWKCSVSSLGEVELYQLAVDPGELDNRAAAEPGMVAACQARLDAWRKQVDWV